MWKRSSHTQSVSVFRRGVIGSVFSNFNLLFPRFLFPLGARQTFNTFQTPCSHVWDGIFLVAPVYPNRVAPFLYRVDSFLSQLLLFSACGISSSMYFTFEVCTLRRACSHVRGSHFTNILLLLLLLLLFLFQELSCFAFGAVSTWALVRYWGELVYNWILTFCQPHRAGWRKNYIVHIVVAVVSLHPGILGRL